MPVFNSENFIVEAINSILGQSLSDFEFIIIDDASVDRSAEIIKSYSDPRIKLIVKSQNTGYTESLNMGIRIAQGRYIARMDSDDVSMDGRLAKQVEMMDLNQEIAVCGTWVEIIPSREIVRYPIDFEELKIALLDNCALAHPTVMMRRKFLVEHGMLYDKSFEPSEDYDLWTRIASKGRIVNIPEPLLLYRQHDQQISHTKYALQKRNADRCRVRMLLNLFATATPLDCEHAEMVYGMMPLKSIDHLYRVIGWLEGIILLNNQGGVYDKVLLRVFVERKKAGLVREFFLRRKVYTPATLVEYFSANTNVKGLLSFSDCFKLFIKSIIFRRLV